MNEHRQESTVWAADLLGLFARSLRRLWWLCLVLIVLCTALSSRPLVRIYGNVLAICAAVAVPVPDCAVPPALTRNVIEAVYCAR